MSWSIEVTGSAEEISAKFDETRESCAKYGMIEAEQRDIINTKNFAVLAATSYGRIRVSASGHWDIASGVAPSEGNPGGTVSSFGRMSVTITPEPTPIT